MLICREWQWTADVPLPSGRPVLLARIWNSFGKRRIPSLYELFDSRRSGLRVLAVFTGSQRGSEVNTRFGSQPPGLRVEEIHLQYKLATSIARGAHLARAPSFLEPASSTLLLCV